MRKGFKKRYFLLASIQAYATQIAIDKITVISKILLLIPKIMPHKEDEEDPPPLLQNIKPCHCNCYFANKTKQALVLSKKLKKCNCRSKYFSFRRSGIHPPL